MSKFKVDVDTTELDRLLNGLSQQEVNKILFEAIKKGGKALRDSTWNSLLTTRFHIRGSKKNFHKYVKQKNEEIYGESTVSIGSFLWWFEKGTQERIQKTTGRRTGRIAGENFFKKAQENSDVYTQPVLQSIQNSLSKIL